MLALIVSTLLAVPIFLSGRAIGDGGSIVVAESPTSTETSVSTSEVTPPPTESSASSLLDDVETTDLFAAGARDTLPPSGSTEESGPAGRVGDSDDKAIVSDGSIRASGVGASPSPSPATAVPTAVPTTAVPTTAVPTTDAPTTDAPTTAAPTTAAPAETVPPETAPPETAPPETAAPAPEPVAEEPAPEPVPEEPAAPTQPTAEQWAALRNCESGGRYTVVSGNGLYFGAYQFNRATWDSLAASIGRGDLVGVRPNEAAPTDQDVMALALWQQRGNQPWPSCGRFLPAKP